MTAGAFDPEKCDHTNVSQRLLVDGGRQRWDTLCMKCGMNVSSAARGNPKTWKELDEAGSAFATLADAKDFERRSRLVKQAEQRENMSNLERRRFECTVYGSSKFWIVWREGNDCLVDFGAIGATAQRRVKSFNTISAANMEISRRIRTKLKKGYVEVVLRAKKPAKRKARRFVPKPKKKPQNPPGFLKPRRVPKVES